MLEEYVQQYPLAGDSFVAHAAELHTYMVSLITGNSTAEAKIQSNLQLRNEGLNCLLLRDHYEGVGINSIDILHAEKALESLYYMGEKCPHMWLENFETDLTTAFIIYDRKESREVNSNDIKLRILIKKINAHFLQETKSTIEVDMTRITTTMTYDIALANFRNHVNSKFPFSPTSHRVR